MADNNMADNNIILEREHMTPEAYFLYNYLCKYHVGKKNAIKTKDLLPRLNDLSPKYHYTDRDLRACRAECNTYEGNLKYICADNGGYYIAATAEEIEASAEIDKQKAIAHFKSWYTARKRMAHHGQVKIVFTEYEKGLIEAFDQFEKSEAMKAGIKVYEVDGNSINDSADGESKVLIFEDPDGQTRLPI